MDNIMNLLYYILRPTNELEDTELNKNIWFRVWYGVLSNILTGIFTYDNIPHKLVRRIEQSFFNSQFVCAYNDKDYGIVVAPCMPQGDKNAWGEYTGYDLILPNGKHERLKLDDCVIGYNYTTATMADSLLVYQFAKQIAELKISIENAIILSRKTCIVEAPNENALNEILREFNNHRIGSPITVKKRREEEEFKTLEIVQPQTIDNFYDGLRDVLNEFLTTTGLSSLVNPNKKERLIVDEVGSNDDIKNTLLTNRVDNRKIFIADINKKFGTDFKVTIDDNIINTVNSLLEREGGNPYDGQ